MPLSTADRLEILELAARYCYATDSRDAEAYAETFTADGVFDTGNGAPITGRVALAENVRARADGPTMRHFVSNPVIQGDGDSATLRLYLELKMLGEQPVTVLIGHYRDELRREAGAWRFARRTVEVDYSRLG